MYLYVEMFDGWGAFNETQFGCSHPSGCRRIVKIQLTKEQIEELTPRITGSSEGKTFYESINPLCIQSEKR
jgi:hypothetical protein